ncbi:MAG: hypothetical protein M3384_16275 [Acidobacteriota bacterium]|nr:hypothetical protein [Acidobacteriota bacterium]
MKSKQFFLSVTILIAAFGLSGCGWVGDSLGGFKSIVGLNETATVIAPRTYIRSSYAVVAADLLEVKRGETLDILDETDYEKVHWYRVRARDEDATEGWIEAQNVIVGTLLEKSRKLAEEDKDLQPQATAQLRAPTKLRLTPEIRDDNVLLKLEKKGDIETTFDVISWRLVPKAQDDSAAEEEKNGASNTPVRRGRTRNEEIEAAKQEEKPEELEDKYDVWYKVRLDPSVSPAPAGWLFGRQVQLQVPNDILYYQIGQKKFVTWQRLDTVDPLDKTSKDSTKVAKPGSWVILSRSNFVKSKDGNEPDFDGILVMYYDKYREEHITIYRSGEVWGKLPLRVDGTGDNKSFVVNLRNANGEFEEKRFALFKNARGHLQVTPPTDIPKPEK